MRVVLQRVTRAGVSVDDRVVGSIAKGLLLLVGIGPEDGPDDVDAAVEKIAHLRVFPDEHGRMNLSVRDVGGEVLIVSQFTLYGDVARGRRPSLSSAATPDHADPLIERMIDRFRLSGVGVSTGEFGAKMNVELVNDGPVTFFLEFREGAITNPGHR